MKKTWRKPQIVGVSVQKITLSGSKYLGERLGAAKFSKIKKP